MTWKSLICYGVLAKKEASYAATNTTFSNTTDAVLVSELPVVDISYVNDGARPNAPTSAGSLPFMSPTGRFAETSLTMEARGSGSAYTSISTLPPDVHPLLEAAGFSASYAAGAITYSPTSSCAQGDSVALRLFARQQQYTVIGGRTTFTLAADGAGPAVYTFNVSGIVSGSVTDATVANITYNTTLPPKTDNIQLSLGTFTTAVVRSFSLDYGRELAPRVDLNKTDAHAGFAGGRRDMTFTVSIETPATASFDILELQRNATTFATSLTVGSVTGNKVQINLPQCQIIGISNSEDGPVSISELTIKPSANIGANNDISIVYS
jgi:hypothetical protein